MSATTAYRRRLLLPEMEGLTARWYADLRGTPQQVEAWRRQASELTAGLPPGAAILEVAPGPGYFAIELARAGFDVTALDISQTMVEIAREKAALAGVDIDVRHGDASAMPFADASFDLVACQAAFKNFRQPVAALNEMHRVLRAGGRAVIQDMRHEATTADIDAEVAQQGLGRLNGLMTRAILNGLRRRALSVADFSRLAAESRFGGASIKASGIGVEVVLVAH